MNVSPCHSALLRLSGASLAVDKHWRTVVDSPYVWADAYVRALSMYHGFPTQWLVGANLYWFLTPIVTMPGQSTWILGSVGMLQQKGVAGRGQWWLLCDVMR